MQLCMCGEENILLRQPTQTLPASDDFIGVTQLKLLVVIVNRDIVIGHIHPDENLLLLLLDELVDSNGADDALDG